MKTQTLLVLLFAALLTGCSELQPLEPPNRGPTELDQTRARLDKIEDRLTGLQMEQARLEKEMQALQAALQDVPTSTRNQLQLMDNRIRAVEVARETDKKETIDALSKKMADILSARAATPAEPASPSATKRSASEYGYEHVVKTGESLSKIAASYKTTVDAVLKANGIKNPNSIRVGQKLWIPQ